jgi:hypothetical protein
MLEVLPDPRKQKEYTTINIPTVNMSMLLGNFNVCQKHQFRFQSDQPITN